jgi:hypothetical protein
MIILKIFEDTNNEFELDTVELLRYIVNLIEEGYYSGIDPSWELHENQEEEEEVE